MSVKYVREFLKEIIYKRTSNWFMRNWRYINVIYASTQLSNIKTSEDTLNVSMKISSNTNVTFANWVLAKKAILKITSKLSMKTTNLSLVIYVIIQLSYIETLGSTLNVSMKTSNHTYAKFAKRLMVRKVH
jgi:hypothetical protein